MTKKKAIEWQEAFKRTYKHTPEEVDEACDMAISALKKQIPKVPDFEGDGYSEGELVLDTWICPGCGEYYEVDYDDYDFCPKCGQAIDWSGSNEKEN